MRISDWSSDVCSSDLLGRGLLGIADSEDAQQRQRLAVAVAAAIIVPAALLEDDDLFTARLGNDLGRNDEAFGALLFAAVTGQQDVAQRHGEIGRAHV